jgi:Holliday junction resolvase RusA-like endonuclease
MIKLELTFPPSTNNLFATVGKRRIVSKDYAAWRIENGWEIQRLRPGRLAGPVRLDIKLQTGRKADASNCIKAIEDLLVTHGVIDGDGPQFVKDVRARFDSRVSGAVIEIFPIPEAA